MTNQHATWPQERTETAARLWLEGWSAGEIAAELKCGLTRNAIIGKIHRLGLARPRRPGPARSVRFARAARERVVRITATKAKPMPKEAPPLVEPLNVPIIEIGAFQCRAVVDQSEWGAAKMCGHPTHGTGSWCAAHAAMFFTLQDRKAAA